jgi:hypothetical protein
VERTGRSVGVWSVVMCSDILLSVDIVAFCINVCHSQSGRMIVRVPVEIYRDGLRSPFSVVDLPHHHQRRTRRSGIYRGAGVRCGIVGSSVPKPVKIVEQQQLNVNVNLSTECRVAFR